MSDNSDDPTRRTNHSGKGCVNRRLYGYLHQRQFDCIHMYFHWHSRGSNHLIYCTRLSILTTTVSKTRFSIEGILSVPFLERLSNLDGSMHDSVGLHLFWLWVRFVLFLSLPITAVILLCLRSSKPYLPAREFWIGAPSWSCHHYRCDLGCYVSSARCSCCFNADCVLWHRPITALRPSLHWFTCAHSPSFPSYQFAPLFDPPIADQLLNAIVSSPTTTTCLFVICVLFQKLVEKLRIAWKLWIWPLWFLPGRRKILRTSCNREKLSRYGCR